MYHLEEGWEVLVDFSIHIFQSNLQVESLLKVFYLIQLLRNNKKHEIKRDFGKIQPILDFEKNDFTILI